MKKLSATIFTMFVIVLPAHSQDTGRRTSPVSDGQDIIVQNITAAPSHEGPEMIRTYYNMNAPIAEGTTDPTRYRTGNGTVTDTHYQPAMPRIPSEMAPVRIGRGQPDPLKDETKAAFRSDSWHENTPVGFANASSEKEVLAVELCGYGQDVPFEFAGIMREQIAKGAASRGRHYVLDAQIELGQTYQDETVYYGGNSGQFHFTPRLDSLYCKGVRYVISGVVARYYTHHFYSSKDAKYPTYESLFTVFITGYDLDAHTILPTYWFNLKGTGSRQSNADSNAFSGFSHSVFSYITDNMPVTTTITALGAPDKKGKYKTCTIAAGNGMGSAKTDIYKVYPAGDTTLSNNIGKLKVTSAGDTGSTCSIQSGQAEIVQAIQNGEDIILLSSGQSLF